jgi:hypothetical protein
MNAMAWLEAAHGQDAVARVLRRCSPAVNERYISAIAIEWHDFDEFVQVLEAIEAEVGRGDGRTAFASGRYSAEQNTRGLMKRALFYLASPEYLMRKAAGLWRQYNECGDLLLCNIDSQQVLLELRGLPRPHELLCESLSGWMQVVAEAIGARGAHTVHPTCRLRGAARCLHRIDWDVKRAKDERQLAQLPRASRGP